MASIFHNSSLASTNVFTTGLSVTGGAAIDALTVNGIAITGSGGSGGSVSIDTTGKNAIMTIAGSVTLPLASQFGNSDTNVPSTSVTRNLASNIDTVNGEVILLNSEVNELQLLVENLTGISILNGTITSATAAANAITTAAVAGNSLFKSGGTMTGAITLANVASPIIGSGSGLDLSLNQYHGTNASNSFFGGSASGNNVFVGSSSSPYTSNSNIHIGPNYGIGSGNNIVSLGCLYYTGFPSSTIGSSSIIYIGRVDNANVGGSTSVNICTGTNTNTIKPAINIGTSGSSTTILGGLTCSSGSTSLNINTATTDSGTVFIGNNTSGLVNIKGSVTIGTASLNTYIIGGITLNSTQDPAYQISLGVLGYINIGNGTNTATASNIVIGSSMNVLASPNTTIGQISGSGTSQISIGCGGGTGSSTVFIGVGTNTGINQITIGSAGSTVTIKGSVYQPLATGILTITSLSTSATSAITFGATSQPLTIQGSTINLNGTVNINGVAYSGGGGGGGSFNPLTANSFGTTTTGIVALGTSTYTTNINGNIILGADQDSAYQILLSPGYINIGNSQSSAYGATVNIGISNNAFGAPNTVIGNISYGGNTSVSIGCGYNSGCTGRTTVNIGSGPNTTNNLVYIGNPAATLTMKGATSISTNTGDGSVSIGNSTGNVSINGNVTINGSAYSGGGAATSTSTNFGSASTVTTAVSLGNLANTPSTSVQGIAINLLNPVSTPSATINIGNNTSATGTVNIGVAGSSNVNIANSSTVLTIKGSTYNVPNNTYPPISTSATDTASINVVTQVYNMANMTASTTQAGMVQLVDSSSSTSITQAPTANALKAVATVANAALTTTTLTTATGFGSSATSNVNVGSSGYTLNLQGVPNPVAFQLAFSDEATAITTSNMVNIRSPFAFYIRTSSRPLFMLYSLGTAGTTSFDIMVNGVSIYSTRPSIFYYASPTNAQYTSAGSQGVLTSNPIVITQYDLIKVYVFSAGTGMTGAKCIITSS